MKGTTRLERRACASCLVQSFRVELAGSLPPHSSKQRRVRQLSKAPRLFVCGMFSGCRWFIARKTSPVVLLPPMTLLLHALAEAPNASVIHRQAVAVDHPPIFPCLQLGRVVLKGLLFCQKRRGARRWNMFEVWAKQEPEALPQQAMSKLLEANGKSRQLVPSLFVGNRIVRHIFCPLSLDCLRPAHPLITYLDATVGPQPWTRCSFALPTSSPTSAKPSSWRPDERYGAGSTFDRQNGHGCHVGRDWTCARKQNAKPTDVKMRPGCPAKGTSSDSKLEAIIVKTSKVLFDKERRVLLKLAKCF